jgi:hypothetical protein
MVMMTATTPSVKLFSRLVFMARLLSRHDA